MFGILFEGLPENALNGGVHCEPSVNWKRSKIDYFPSISFPQRSWARTTLGSAAPPASGGGAQPRNELEPFVMLRAHRRV